MTRVTITTAFAALSMSLAPSANAYGIVPEASLPQPVTTVSAETCTLTPAESLASLLNLPANVVIATC